MIILDSDDLPDDWKSDTEDQNVSNKYNWEKLDEAMLEQEEDEDDSEGDENLASEPEHDEDENNHSKVKRVLAFTSEPLLKLFSECKRGSIDGTFKTSSKLWRQQFIFMVKYQGHWIPVIWGWLPDKSVASYKVSMILINQH